MYAEAASGAFSALVIAPYRSDFGVAGDVGLTSPSWTDATIRSEFRMRF